MSAIDDWKTIIKPYLKPDDRDFIVGYIESLLSIAKYDGALELLERINKHD